MLTLKKSKWWVIVAIVAATAVALGSLLLSGCNRAQEPSVFSDISRSDISESTGRTKISKKTKAKNDNSPVTKAVSTTKALPTQTEKKGGNTTMHDPKENRELVWQEEFSSSWLDTRVWNFERTMGADDFEYNNSEKYAHIENDQMILRTYRSQKQGCSFALPEGLTTRYGMNYRYGYLEMRARVPFRHGVWPSFWMKTNTPFARADYMAEIDIFEVFTSKDELFCNLHKWQTKNGELLHTMLPDYGIYRRNYRFAAPENLNNEYHRYGFEWDKDMMRFWVDDTCYASFFIDDDHDFDRITIPGMDGFHDFAYPIINNEVYSPVRNGKNDMSCVMTEDDPLPVEYAIDWIRLYQDPVTEKIRFHDDIAKKR